MSTATASNHYDALGVTRTASADEIKRAWARLVRQHSPDKDPEGNRRINEAKTTLLDAGAREEYDALLDFGDEITELLETASDAMAEEDWDEAARAYKEILAFHPNNYSARNHLALCYSYSGDNVAAKRLYEGLLAKQSEVALYWSNYGHVLLELSEDDEAFYSAATEAFGRAAQLEPYNASHYVSLSRISRAQGRYREAEDYIESAVGADGKADVDDLDALFELPWIHLFSGELHKLREDAKRIQSVLPPGNQELCDYAGFRFFRMAADLAERDYYQEAAAFVAAGKVLNPDIGEIKDLLATIERNARLLEQGEQLREDALLLKAVQFLAIVCIARYFEWGDDAETEENAVKALEAIDTWNRNEINSAIDRLRSQYPDVYWVNRDLYEKCRSMGSAFANRPTYASTPQGCGCGLIAAGLLLLACVLTLCCAVS